MAVPTRPFPVSVGFGTATGGVRTNSHGAWVQQALHTIDTLEYHTSSIQTAQQIRVRVLFGACLDDIKKETGWNHDHMYKERSQ